jgi:outer membrane protein
MAAMKFQKVLAGRSCVGLIWVCILSQLSAQQPFVERPQTKIVWRPYTPPAVAPAVLTNSDRLHGLIRAGRLYLTVQDAIALAIENNLDLQVDRYGPLRAEWAVERAQAGGPLKGSTSISGNSTPTISGQGVKGAEAAANVLGNNGGGSSNQNNGSFTQIGPVTPNLDPTLVANNMLWSRQTTPQANLQISGTTALLDIDRYYEPYLQQGFLTGGNVQVALQENYQNENSPGDYLRPSLAPVAYVYVNQRLLSGRGIGVNNRYIRVAQKQAVAATVTFRSQLLNLVANVVSMYWELSGAQGDLKEKQVALDFAQKFYEDTSKRIELGAIAKVDIYRAQAEVATRRQDLAISQQNVSQQEITLKSLLSRNGLDDPTLDAAEIVTLDRFEVPQSDDLPPLRQMVATALAKRPDVQLDKINNEGQEISAAGTANAILPSATGYAYTLNRAQAGGINPISPLTPPPSQVGGLGNALQQIFTNQYNTRVAGVNFSGPLRNRSDQADFGIDQLQLRQGDLVERKNRNDMVVAISNEAVAVRQAGLRYRNAVTIRELQQDLLEQEQQKFRLGSSTIDLVIAAARTLTAAQSDEVAALSTYSRTRVGLDQTLGTTLDTNHVSVEEALSGKVKRESTLPPSLP